MSKDSKMAQQAGSSDHVNRCGSNYCNTNERAGPRMTPRPVALSQPAPAGKTLPPVQDERYRFLRG